MPPSERSYAKITDPDLERLAGIAREDLEDFFAREPAWGDLYRDLRLCSCLCQGAALHYVDGRHGVNDFDVWTFFRRHPLKPFPYRRHSVRDFGSPKFGVSGDHPHFEGRHIDLFGRAISMAPEQDPYDAIRYWLRISHGGSPFLLARQAIVVLDPAPDRGRIIWTPEDRPAD